MPPCRTPSFQHRVVDPMRIANMTMRQPLSAAQRAAHTHIAAKMAANESLSMLAIGGSLEAGRYCKSFGLQERECSYPSRFARWLETCMSASLYFDNRASGGTTTAGILPQLPLLIRFAAQNGTLMDVADLLLISFSVNDHYEEQDWVTKDGAASQGSGGAMVAGATEAMLRFLLTATPHMALVMVEPFCFTPSASAQAHRWIATTYGVPYVSYADTLVGECDETSWTSAHRELPRDSHTTASTHEYLAFALQHWWLNHIHLLGADGLASRDRTGELPPDSPSSLSHVLPITFPLLNGRHGHDLRQPLVSEMSHTYQICQPVSVYDARTLHASTPREISGRVSTAHEDGHAFYESAANAWRLQDDRQGKPAWVTDGPGGAQLRFGVRFGRWPRVTLVFDSSYVGFGQVKLSFVDLPDTTYALLDARRSQKGALVTQTSLVSMNVGQRHPDKKRKVFSVADGVFGFGIARHSNHTLQLELLPREHKHKNSTHNRFQLRFLSSC